MINKDQLKIVQKKAEEFFSKACFEVEAEVFFEEEKTIHLKIKAEEPQILIGEKGQVLSEIQHLLRLVLRKQILEPFFLNLDINNYKEKKYEYLKELACSTADEAVLSKKIKELAPMPAHERRIIHLELANRGDVVTESVGQGRERKVVISPAN